MFLFHHHIPSERERKQRRRLDRDRRECDAYSGSLCVWIIKSYEC